MNPLLLGFIVGIICAAPGFFVAGIDYAESDFYKRRRNRPRVFRGPCIQADSGTGELAAWPPKQKDAK